MLMEKVIIQSHILRYAERDIQVEMTMWDLEKKTLKAIIWTTITHYNFKTMKAEIHAQSLIDRFKPLEDPLEKAVSFEERVKEVRANGFSPEQI
jgi:acyl-CoA thioester hydrolase